MELNSALNDTLTASLIYDDWREQAFHMIQMENRGMPFDQIDLDDDSWYGIWSECSDIFILGHWSVLIGRIVRICTKTS